MEELKE